MIEFTKGDLLKSKAEALVNTVNCVGVMGRGIALQFKKAFPENYKEYKRVCDGRLLQPGKMLTFDTRSLTNEQRYIINFPTKRHWKGKSRMEDVVSGLCALVAEVQEKNIASIAIPPLGCGLGGLRWEDVRAEIEKAFAELPDVKVYVYEPTGAPRPAAMTNKTKSPGMTQGRAALLELMRKYLQGLMAPSISLLELQKLMYFMQVAGEGLRLSFVKGQYGPYAENLRHVLNHIEGHFIVGYGDGGDDPGKPLEYRKEASKAAQAYLQPQKDTLANIRRVAALIDGFESPYGMELLATVHWLVTQENAKGVDEVYAKVKQWSPRKAEKMQKRHIEVAYTMLAKQKWI